MRSVGAVLSFLCGLIAIGLLCIGYIGVFDKTQVIPDFESTPREGWDYWMRLEFWHDIRSYAMWVLLALGGVIIPIFGHIRNGLAISTHRVTDWILVSFAALYLLLWSWGIAAAVRRPVLDWVVIPPFIMFAGSLFGLFVFGSRVRNHNNEEARVQERSATN